MFSATTFSYFCATSLVNFLYFSQKRYVEDQIFFTGPYFIDTRLPSDRQNVCSSIFLFNLAMEKLFAHLNWPRTLTLHGGVTWALLFPAFS